HWKEIHCSPEAEGSGERPSNPVNTDLLRNQPDIRLCHENARLRFPRAGSSTWRFVQHCAEAEQVCVAHREDVRRWSVEIRRFDGLKSRESGFRLARTVAQPHCLRGPK